MYKKLFCFIACLAAFGPISGWAASASQPTEQIATLDQEIKKLKDERSQAKMQAYIASGNASQWLGQSWVNYQEAIRKQERNEARVKVLDARIAELEKQKAALEAAQK